MSDERRIYICALRGGLSGFEGGSYIEEIAAYDIQTAAWIFLGKHNRWPTDIGLQGSNLDYTHRLEQRVAELEAAMPKAVYDDLLRGLDLLKDEYGKDAGKEARAWLAQRNGTQGVPANE